jgi:Domain of unknown function (DUF5666)
MARRLRTKLFQPLATAAVLLCLLSSCGGGGGLVADGGIGGSGIVASGAVTAKGSIFVNGVEYRTDGASFEREGEAEVIFSGDDSALQVGMVLRVEGTLDEGGATGRAERIRFEDLVEGPVESMTLSSTQVKTAVVLGQTVIADQGIPGFDALVAGAVVEVSGFERPDGSLQASFILLKANSLAEFETAGGVFEVKGRIGNLDPLAQTFNLGTLGIDFAGVQPRNLDAAPNGILENGVLVEVKGSALVGGRLTATDVEVRTPGLGIADHALAEVEGLIAVLNRPAATFTLNGQPVDFTGAAFQGGVAADLASGVKVEAKGPLAGGILRATEVEFKDSVKLEGNLAAPVLQNGILTLQGLSSIGVQVETGVTEFEDVPALGNLQVGEHLRIRGRPDPSGTGVRATQVRRLGPSADLTLQGPLSAFDALTQNLVILGVTVNTLAIPDARFEREDTVIGRDAFFNALAPGLLVKAQGGLDQTLSPTWREIELEE